MPVIRYVPQDPTDVVLQGEQLRVGAMLSAPNATWPIITDDEVDGTLPLRPNVLLAGMISTDPMQAEVPAPQNGFGVLGSVDSGGSMIRSNAAICTPTGAVIPFPLGRKCVLMDFVQDTTLFSISGQTVTGAGAALGGCRVVVYETGRIAVDGNVPYSQGGPSSGNTVTATWASESPVVAQAISDGSGNFSISVPMNTAYQLTGYLTGSPDKAGITRNDVVPTATSTLIYLRDPTVPDGPSGSAAYRPIGSAVVRRLAA